MDTFPISYVINPFFRTICFIVSFISDTFLIKCLIRILFIILFSESILPMDTVSRHLLTL